MVTSAPSGAKPTVTPPVIAGIGVAHPPAIAQTDLWDGFFSAHYAGVGRGLAKRIFANSGVVTRHGVINPLVEDPSSWSTGARMERYLVEALPLSKDAVCTALDQAGVAANNVGLLVVCSCTGYATPGLDILLARDLGLPADARRVFVGHMGCYAALPGLGVVGDYVALHQRPAVLLCVELPSVHVQPATVDPQQVVAHALFSDAAAAVVLTPDGPGPRVTEIASLTDTTTADHMTWQVTDLGFRMGLSSAVPDVLSKYVRELVDPMLDRAGLRIADVGGWSVHPGGPRILDVVAGRLELSQRDMTASRAGLAEHGNCSSPTVLMILDRLLRDGLPAGAPAMLMAFGPGLTLYAALLQ
jgi:alkylresorcinol/alkylpyrone synthase